MEPDRRAQYVKTRGHIQKTRHSPSEGMRAHSSAGKSAAPLPMQRQPAHESRAPRHGQRPALRKHRERPARHTQRKRKPPRGGKSWKHEKQAREAGHHREHAAPRMDTADTAAAPWSETRTERAATGYGKRHRPASLWTYQQEAQQRHGGEAARPWRARRRISQRAEKSAPTYRARAQRKRHAAPWETIPPRGRRAADSSREKPPRPQGSKDRRAVILTGKRTPQGRPTATGERAEPERGKLDAHTGKRCRETGPPSCFPDVQAAPLPRHRQREQEAERGRAGCIPGTKKAPPINTAGGAFSVPCHDLKSQREGLATTVKHRKQEKGSDRE